MNLKNILSLLFWGLFATTLVAQEKERTWSLSGYVSEMPSLMMVDPDSTLYWENLLHNRLNFEWQPAENWKFNVGMRNRLINGNLLQYPGYAASIGFDRGWVDLSWNIADTRNVLLNTSFDRFFVSFEKDKWSVQLGRQRINWGQTLVWNPNDIFNTYSYFDFDYVERSGCDAVRITYYHNETASTEVAASVNFENKVTAAALHRWNYRNTDFQAIAGVLNESDILAGGAWTSDLRGLNFRGEFTYFHPLKNFADTAGTIAISVGADYMFRNSLMLQVEVLYNNVGNVFSSSGILGIYAAPLSAKYLSISDWTLFGQASYPITPRLTGALSAMYYTGINTVYAGANVDFSVAENWDLSAIAQYFAGYGNLFSSQMLLGFVRLKYSF